MIHQRLLEEFKRLFGETLGVPEKYYANGKKSIRIVMKNKREYIFYYYGLDEFRLETQKYHVKDLKGDYLK